MTTWGPYATGTSGRKFRLGVHVVVISESNTSVTLEAALHFYGTYGVNDVSNNCVVGGGTFSRSGAISVVASFNQDVVLWTQQQTISKIYEATQSVDFTASLSGLDVYGTGTTATLSASGIYTVAARPYDTPAAPSDVTATRVSDAELTLTWTRNASSAAPYASQSVYVSIDGASPTLVANVSGSLSTYTYASQPNHKYVFTVRASNPAGTTASDPSDAVYTTPAALASLSAAVVSAGVIRLTLAKRPTPFTEAQVVIEETHDGGGTWATKATIPMSTLSASTSTTWDDTDAETGGTVQYRAVVETTGGAQGTLSSGYKTSNTLVLNTPPNAPTGLAPSGPVDASSTVRLGWTHNPSSDGASQSSRKIEYSTDGGSTQTQIVAGDSTLAYYDWTPNLDDFTAGQTIVWRVATAGSQPGVYGAWSAWQPITLYGSLAVTLVENYPPETHGGGPLPVAWESSPTWGTATQAQYRVTLTDQESGQIVYDTGALAGTSESVEIPSSVQTNGRTYIVSVTLIDNHQVSSQPATRTVEMDYLPPGPVGLTWELDDSLGALMFYPTFSEESSSAVDDTVAWSLERSRDGDTWEPVGSVVGEAPIMDALPVLGATSWYRATSYTELDVAGEPTVYQVPAGDVRSRWAWLNYGDSYQSRVRFGWALSPEVAAARASESFEVEGRDYPVPVFGESVSRTIRTSGRLMWGDGIPEAWASSTDAEMIALAERATVCIYRDPHGSWFPVRVFDMKVQPLGEHVKPRSAAVSFSIERVSA